MKTKTDNMTQKRLDEFFDTEWGWNDFPQAEVVRIWTEDDIFRVFHLGERIAKGVQGQARLSALPQEILEEINAKDKNLQSVVGVHFILDNGAGMGVQGTPNILAVFPLTWRKDRKIVVAEIGCKHKFKHTAVGRCAHETKCEKCGFEYFVDSSD